MWPIIFVRLFLVKQPEYFRSSSRSIGIFHRTFSALSLPDLRSSATGNIVLIGRSSISNLWEFVARAPTQAKEYFSSRTASRQHDLCCRVVSTIKSSRYSYSSETQLRPNFLRFMLIGFLHRVIPCPVPLRVFYAFFFSVSFRENCNSISEAMTVVATYLLLKFQEVYSRSGVVRRCVIIVHLMRDS